MIIQERIPSSVEALTAFISRLYETLKSFSLTEDDLFHIKLSLEEALVNAARHGNKLNAALFVDVTISLDSDKIEITVRDEGRGFDYEHLPDPTLAENLQKTHGRGVYLMRKLMDEVRYFDSGRSVTATKFFKQHT
jgi:serine/threonine-protein kinase RsbW